MDNRLLAGLPNRVPTCKAVDMSKKKIASRLGGLVLAMLAAGTGWYLSQRETTCTNKCNILLVSIDSLRADHMGAYGYNRDTTPNFDRLAQQGSLFLNTSSASFLTPISEMSVFSGLYPTSHGLLNFDGVLSDQVKTLPQYMKTNGYRTVALTSSPEFLVYPGLRQSFSKGFDSYPDQSDKRTSEQVNDRSNPPIQSVNNALANIASSNEKPTFMWLAIGSVHWPFGKGVENRYADKDYKGVFSGTPDFRTLFAYNGILYPSKVPIRDEDTQYVRDQYDNGVRGMDDYLGQILDSLKEQKLDKKTIIVIQSEHGEGLGENGYYAHYDIFDTETRVPLLIVDPRNKEQKRVKSSVGSVDILPTVLEMTNNSVPSSIQGRSLLGIMNGDESDGKRDAAYIERVPLWEETSLELVQQVLGIRGIKNEKTGARDIAIRTEKWKYIKRLAKDRVEEISWWKAISGSPVTVPPEELYDLEADPLETKNVISEHPDVAAELRTRLDAWYAKVNSQRQPTKSTELIQPYQ